MADVIMVIAVFLFSSILMWAAVSLTMKPGNLAVVSNVREGDIWYPVIRVNGRDIVLDADGIIEVGRIISRSEERCIELEEKVKAQDERLELMGDALYKAGGINHP